MAKKSDRRTRALNRVAKVTGTSVRKLVNLSHSGRNVVQANGSPLTSEQVAQRRLRGRRGVRARARMERIMARKENGTYTQPKASSGSNSP